MQNSKAPEELSNGCSQEVEPKIGYRLEEQGITGQTVRTTEDPFPTHPTNAERVTPQLALCDAPCPGHINSPDPHRTDFLSIDV